MKVKGEKEPVPFYVTLDGMGFLAWYKEEEGPRPKEGGGGGDGADDGGEEGEEEKKDGDGEGAAEADGAENSDTPVGRVELCTALSILLEVATLTIHVTFESTMPVFLNIGKEADDLGASKILMHVMPGHVIKTRHIDKYLIKIL